MERSHPILVNHQDLSSEALDNLIDSFISREGTDYGWQEINLETKRKQIFKQLSQGEIKIVFDPNTESVTLLTKAQLKKFNLT